jgi:hypothetical protein
MNAAEHIVESYFRLCKGFFTLTDRKVEKGVGRQLDILAMNLKSGQQVHIEVAVTHRKHWCPTISQLDDYFEKKFFGVPPERKGKSQGTTDFEKGKSYFKQIEAEYTAVGFDPLKVKRTFVCWLIKEGDNAAPINVKFFSKQVKQTFDIEILSLRDFILPALEDAIGTANYDDEVLRTLAFIKQRGLQTTSAKISHRADSKKRAAP